MKVEKLSKGVKVSVNWTCSHCGNKNEDFFVSDKENILSGAFEEDLRCNACASRSTVQCRDVTTL